MTKQDIVRALCERLDMPKAQAQQVVQTTFDALIDSLVQEGRVELRNFGVFQIKQRQGRTARNPRTGEAVHVEPRSSVSFKPGKEMEDRVRQLDKPQVAQSTPSPKQPAAQFGHAPPNTASEPGYS
ncbi:MAG: integration host factor subunit beta [Planctomycetia bacterium]|nr:integration host factor subunit beta [Planctomycetia bacterium]